MPAHRSPGMDHDIYPFSPITVRPPFRLPGGQSIAIYIVLQLEYWELLPPTDAYREPRFVGEFGTYFPEYRNWTSREYGNRIGIFRILDVLDRLKLKPSVAINAAILDRHPHIVREVAERKWEILAHGLSANRMITSRMSETEEREFICISRDAIGNAFGSPPKGWLGQDFGATPRTSRILSELGFTFTLDWSNDEQPYRHHGNAGIVSVPAPTEWDDVQTHFLRKVPIHLFPTLLSDAVDELAGSPATSARTLAIGVHPWMFGAPHRIRYLREALEHIASDRRVHLTTAGELAANFLAQA